jgi:hypothetical protein
MKYRKSIYNKKSIYKNKRISKRKKFKRSNKKRKQSGGFIGTMFSAALAPVKMLSKPVVNKLSSMMSNIKNNSSNNSSSNSSEVLNNLDNGTLNSIRMNNSNISTLKQLSSYGYDNRTLTSYISQLQHINV